MDGQIPQLDQLSPHGDGSGQSGFVLSGLMPSIADLGLLPSLNSSSQGMMSMHHTSPPIPMHPSTTVNTHAPPPHPPPGIRSVAPGVLTGLPAPPPMLFPTQDITSATPSPPGIVPSSTLISPSALPGSYADSHPSSISATFDAAAMNATVSNVAGGSDASASPLPLLSSGTSSTSSGPPTSPPDASLYFSPSPFDTGLPTTSTELESVLNE
jgi:hypothetical protein